MGAAEGGSWVTWSLACSILWSGGTCRRGESIRLPYKITMRRTIALSVRANPLARGTNEIGLAPRLLVVVHKCRACEYRRNATDAHARRLEECLPNIVQ